MFAISGAAGNLGRLTAQRVAELVDDVSELVLLSRSPDEASAVVPGAHARFADFNEPESVTAALQGVERVLFVSTDTVDGRSRQHTAAIDAAAVAGVEYILYTSMLSPGPSNPALISESHWATEEHLRTSGIDHTILRFSLYSDFQIYEALGALGSGRFVHNRGDGGCSYIARADCALVAAAVLSGDGHRGTTYELTGPASLNAAELAALYSDVGGRAVEAVAVTDDQLLLELVGDDSGDGHVQYGVALTVSLGQAIREGHFSAVTSTVHDLTGRQPSTVRHLLEASADTLRATR
ncbi:MAG TPA: NAD(P)H-binding protein [Terrimesophilobacter sp.]|nr:NAD(P)H-binding protein [Terrimesophilobacter sp.]